MTKSLEAYNHEAIAVLDEKNPVQGLHDLHEAMRTVRTPEAVCIAGVWLSRKFSPEDRTLLTSSTGSFPTHVFDGGHHSIKLINAVDWRFRYPGSLSMQERAAYNKMTNPQGEVDYTRMTSSMAATALVRGTLNGVNTTLQVYDEILIAHSLKDLGVE